MTMTKCKAVRVIVTMTVWGCLAAAQNSTKSASSAKSNPAPAHTAATKPLTPKSAMPPPHKSTVAPPASTSVRNTNAELNHLERQPIRASNGGNAGAAKASPAKAAGTPNANGSGINATYQPPAAKKN